MKQYAFLLIFLAWVSGATAESSAAQNTLIPLEVFGALPGTSMVTVSPSGQRLGYRLTDGQRDMFVVYDFKQSKIIGGINISEIRPGTAYFVSDENVVLVASENTRIRGFRGRHDVSAAFSYNIPENKIRQLLVAGNGIYAGQSALGNVVGMSSDGKSVYMPAWFEAGSYALMKKSLTGKRQPRKVLRGASDAIDYFVFNDQVVARERFDNEKDLHRIQARIDDKWIDIYSKNTNLRTRNFVGLTAEGKQLVFLAYNNDRVGYYTMSLADGGVTGPIFNPEDKSVERVLMNVDRIVYGVQYKGFKPSYDFFDISVNQAIDSLIAQWPDYAITIQDYSSDWQHVVLSVEGADSAKDFYLFTQGSLKFISSSRKNMPKDQIAPVIETKIKARDGLHIPTLLTLPPNKEFSNLPAIMLPHGGPESYDKIGFDWLAQYFASRGYLVIQPQFRGSDGFGFEFKAKGRGEWGRKMQDDLTDTVKTLVKSGYLDQNKLCIVGLSYGGYAALAGATFTPNLYRCAISINGVADVERMMRDERRERSAEHWVYEYWQKVITDGTFQQQHLKTISPINYVENVQIPILLIHGEHDEVVPEHQSEYMYEELKDADKTVTFISLDDGDHYLSSAKNRMQALNAVDSFLAEYL